MKNQYRKTLEGLPDEVVEEMAKGLKYFAVLRERYNDATPTQEQPAAPVQQATPLDWPDKKKANFRELVVRKIWEPDLRSELVDRIVELVVGGYVRPKEVEKIIDRAEHRKRLFDDTNGAKGCESLWRTIGAWAKERWIQAGRQWTATSKRLEPQPKNLKPVTEVIEERMERDYDGNPVSRQRTVVSRENMEFINRTVRFN